MTLSRTLFILSLVCGGFAPAACGDDTGPGAEPTLQDVPHSAFDVGLPESPEEETDASAQAAPASSAEAGPCILGCRGDTPWTTYWCDEATGTCSPRNEEDGTRPETWAAASP